MKRITARTMEIKGGSYEIGRSLGRLLSTNHHAGFLCTAGFDGFTSQDLQEAQEMFRQWCPGLNEELAGFADECQVPLESVIFFAMTYLRPNCSQLAVTPAKTAGGHPLLARSYEFSDEAEDFTLIKTGVEGKYTHMGTSVLFFGRDDGFNEHGLAVSMSSCGFPVGAGNYMRRPALKGLQFWAVIRSVLENCRDTKEALHFLRDMPIAYNLNLMLLDRSGEAALVETLDGRKEILRLENPSDTPCLYAANHPVVDSLIALEPEAMEHSLRRYRYLSDQMAGAGKVTPGLLKEMLLASYPDGLCCHCYKDFFGTTKSMVMDPLDGTIELCWGGRKENGWRIYRLSDPLPFSEQEILIEEESASPSMFCYHPIRE